MNLDHLLSLVRRPEYLDGTHTADLEALVQEYPYFTAGHLLLLKAYKQQNSIHFKKQLRKVAAIAPDRAQVYALTEAWPEVDSVVVDDMGEKLPADAAEGMFEQSVGAQMAPEALVASTDVVAEMPALPVEESALDLAASPESPTTELEKAAVVSLPDVQSQVEELVAQPELVSVPEAMVENELIPEPEVVIDVTEQVAELSTAPEAKEEIKAETATESTETPALETEVIFTFDPERDQVEAPVVSEAPLITEEEVLALVNEIETLPREEQPLAIENMDIQLAPTEDGALHFAFEPEQLKSEEVSAEAVADEASMTAAEPLEASVNALPDIENVAKEDKIEVQVAIEQPASLENDFMEAVEKTAAPEMVSKVLTEIQDSSAQPVDLQKETPASQPVGETAADLGEDYEVFVARPHDRLSWFRFFAGKPLREQPDEVLEQLYMEHMQQDLLQAPVENPVEAIKARVNKAEEVASSREMEEEIKRLAYDSISDDELPASETLARIYEQQQEYKRAIKIYQKLILKFPDKMTYFAGLIEALRQK